MPVRAHTHTHTHINNTHFPSTFFYASLLASGKTRVRSRHKQTQTIPFTLARQRALCLEKVKRSKSSFTDKGCQEVTSRSRTGGILDPSGGSESRKRSGRVEGPERIKQFVVPDGVMGALTARGEVKTPE
jgi:hypothetical protein